MYTQDPHKVVGLARGFMASGLAGTQPGWQVFRSSVRPSHHYVRVASCLTRLQNRGIRDFRWAQRGGDANSHRGACLLWLIINYRVAWQKSLCLQPLHQSKLCQDNWQAGILTVLWFGCPLVELQLWKKGSILKVLLHTQRCMIKKSRGAKMVKDPKKN